MWLCKRDLSRECEGKYRDCTDCVLDKIRAEIEKISIAPFATAYTAKHEALEIIDKYTAESEE